MSSSLGGIGSISSSSVVQGLFDAGRFALATNSRTAVVAVVAIAVLTYGMRFSPPVATAASSVGESLALRAVKGAGVTSTDMARFSGSTAAEIKAKLRGELVFPAEPKAKKGENEPDVLAAYLTRNEALRNQSDVRAAAIGRAVKVATISKFALMMLLASAEVVPTLLILRK